MSVQRFENRETKQGHATRIDSQNPRGQAAATTFITKSAGEPFNSASKEFSPTQAGNFVGAHVGGPTKAGHYFLPAYATAKTTPIERVGVRQHPANVGVERGTGPVVAPQKVLEWKLVYDPTGANGKGAIEATLGKESISLVLRDGDKAKGASLDRFGLFTTHRGGSFVRIYFDDLKYTNRPNP